MQVARLLPCALASILVLSAGCDRSDRQPASVGTASDATAPATAVARNVVVVSLDTVRADHLACYGYGRATSPTLDRLVREGVRFANATATSPWTLPSHASLLTGLYPHRHGATAPELGLSEAPTLAELLAAAGFATAGFVSSSFLSPKRGFDRGFDTYRVVSEWGRHEGGEAFLRNPGSEVSDAALAWLRANADGRFFLFLHYYDAHADYAPPAEDRRAFVESYDGPADGTNGQLLAVRRGQMSYDAADIAHVLALYDGEIRAVDAQLGRIVEFLEESGLASSTLLVVTSDHGEEFLEHGSVLHGRTYYEEVISIPLILRGPGVPTGRSVEDPASLVDVVPTVLGLTGASDRQRARWQGVDLASSWAPGRVPSNRYVLAEADWQNAVPSMYRMVRDGRYKLVQEVRTGATRLYDLRTDPGESRDVAAREPARLAQLRSALVALLAEDPTAVRQYRISPDELERMRALGYVD